MSEPITVLLVDDHAMVRQGVRAFLETQGDIAVVAEAGSGRPSGLRPSTRPTWRWWTSLCRAWTAWRPRAA